MSRDTKKNSPPGGGVRRLSGESGLKTKRTRSSIKSPPPGGVRRLGGGRGLKTPRPWSVYLSSERGQKPPGLRAIERLIPQILHERPFAKLPPSLSEVSIRFVGDPAIHRLNKNYRKKDKPTDVLSFPQSAELGGFLASPSLGDLIISTPTARRQAREYGVSMSNELLRLIIHGLLHLAGYDHEKVPAAEAQRMRRAEQMLMRRYGK